MMTNYLEIKEKYLCGMRVRLLKMNDVQAPPIETEGIVKGVDDIGSILVEWDTGSRLNVVFDEDEIEVVRKGGKDEE